MANTKMPETEQSLAQKGYKFIRTAKCRGENCGQEIEFWETPKGKPQPRDPGTLEPHWATCPNAKDFRGA